MSWCSVRPSRSATRVKLRLADSVALRIASGTSRALPWPNPTRPFWSPITTSAAKPKRLPPLTTFATRLMWTSLSTNSLSRSSRPPLWPPPRSRSPAMVFFRSFKRLALRSFRLCPCVRSIPNLRNQSLEAEPAFARGVRKCLDAAVIEIAAAVEHHFLDAVLYRAFRQQLADRLGRIDVGASLAAFAQRLFQRGGRGQRLALQVVDDLRIDVLRRAEYRQARPAAGGATQRQPHALLAPGIRNLEFRHDRLRYFFLPSLRKINSSEYRTPLPL